jgi:flagellar hook assembly protein FlgD
LAEGKHTIRVKAWDISNNTGEGSTEFIVAANLQGAISELMNYPNPFAASTNFRFNHTVNGSDLKVTINIYTLDGRLVKSLQQSISGTGLVDNINWDGQTDAGTNLSKGIYVFQAVISGKNSVGSSLSTNSKLSKLVIMK